MKLGYSTMHERYTLHTKGHIIQYNEEELIELFTLLAKEKFGYTDADLYETFGF